MYLSWQFHNDFVSSARHFPISVLLLEAVQSIVPAFAPLMMHKSRSNTPAVNVCSLFPSLSSPNDHISGIPSLGCQVDRPGESSTIERCSGNERHAECGPLAKYDEDEV